MERFNLGKYQRAFIAFSVIVSGALLSIVFQNCGSDVRFSAPAALKTEAPLGVPSARLTINNGAMYTQNQTVQLEIAAQEANEMQLRNSSCPGTSDPWFNLQKDLPWQLTDIDGMSEVYLVVRSDKGELSSCEKAQIILDRQAPTLDLKSAPAKIFNQKMAALDYESHDSSSGVDLMYCRTPGEINFTPCQNRVDLTNLVDGNNNVAAYVTDKAGNHSDIVEYSWFVDTVPPLALLADPIPAANIYMNTVQVSFVGLDENGSGIKSFECLLDDQVIPNCTSPVSLTNLVDKKYVFRVRAIDNALWASEYAQAEFTVDTKPSGAFQVLGITGGSDTKVDNYLTDKTTAVVNWSASEGAQSYTAAILSEQSQVVCAAVTVAGGLTSANFAGCLLADNTKYIARVTSLRNGQTTSAPDYLFTVDTMGPVIVIRNVTSDDELKMAGVDFTVSDVGSGVESVVCYKKYMNDLSQDNCKDLMHIDYSNLLPGKHEFYITARDRLGFTTTSNIVSFNIQEIVCDPFKLVEGRCQKGIKANLYYANAADRALGTSALGSLFNSVDVVISRGIRSNVIIYMPYLHVPLRSWTDGFITSSSALVKDDSGQVLNEWFALDMQTVIKLGNTDEEGYYQFILVSDDGSKMSIDPGKTGTYRNFINNDGVHGNRVGCAAAGDALMLTKTSRIAANIKYYQGPRYNIAMSVFWRKVSAANSARSSLCGKDNNYTTLQNEGFVPLTGENFILEEVVQ